MDKGQCICLVVVPVYVYGQGPFIGDALCLFPLGGHFRPADSVCTGVYMEAGSFSQDRLQKNKVCGCSISDGIDADQPELLCSLFSASIEVTYGERPHFGRDFLRIQGMGPVRLLEVAGHFCQQFIAGNTHVDGKTQLFSDSIADLTRKYQCSLPVFRPDPVREVEKSLIDGHLLEERCVLCQDIHKRVGIFPVGLKIRRDKDQVGTLLQCLDNRLARLDTIFFGRNGFGRNDPVTGLDISSHCRGNRAQIYGSGIFLQALKGRPRQKSRIHIHMKNCPIFLLHLHAPVS